MEGGREGGREREEEREREEGFYNCWHSVATVPPLMDGVAEVSVDPHHAVLVHLSARYLLVHLRGQHARLVVDAVRHLQPIAVHATLLLLLRLNLLHVLRSKAGKWHQRLFPLTLLSLLTIS